MTSAKRVSVATVLGLIFGIIAWLIARTGIHLPWSEAVTMILSRTVLGFAIGVSAWRLSWWANGLLFGLIFGLPVDFGAVWAGKGWHGFVAALIAGLIIGFLVELFTSVVFHAKGRMSHPAPMPAA